MGKLKKISGFIELYCSDKYKTIRNLVNLFFIILSIIGVLQLFSMPICVITVTEEPFKVIASNVFKAMSSDDAYILAYSKIQLAALIVILIFLSVLFVLLLKTLLSLQKENRCQKLTQKAMFLGVIFIVIYTLFTWVFSPINVAKGGHTISSVNYGTLIYILIICLLYASYNGVLNIFNENKIEDNIFSKKEQEERAEKKKKIKEKKLELVIYVVILSLLSIISLLTKIVKISVSYNSGFSSSFSGVSSMQINISGWNLLFKTSTILSSSQRLLSFCVLILFILILATCFLSIISFVSNSKLFYKISVYAILASGFSCLLVGLFGQYYKIVQSMNTEMMTELLYQYIDDLSVIFDYSVKSSSLIYFIIYIGVLMVVFIRNPFTKAMNLENSLQVEEFAKMPKSVEIKSGLNSDELNNTGNESNAPVIGTEQIISDPCPVFTEIDNKYQDILNELEQRKQALFESPTLPKLIDYIVQYARDSRLHLYYTYEDIATFIAGLGTTRLSILQGMSGTGKTSLPKIVAEALYSLCDIVEVESSWRDKNELLGYYNEFNKVYTPKKFTQALYKAKLNSDVITFIVLDEMNLSRIEYYFSDFLSLMENEPDKREIKLVNIKLNRKTQKGFVSYKGLKEGHTLQIPQNVWFVGTANRDESTYDISDKVYDRAYTMNFDKRAKKVQSYGSPLSPKYLSSTELIKMFDDAKTRINYNIEDNPIIKQVEQILAPYHLSFGNRILIQMETFVKIYAGCFEYTEASIKDALEIILLSKVIRKLELKNIDDKDSLAQEFADLNLMRCSNFIISLKED